MSFQQYQKVKLPHCLTSIDLLLTQTTTSCTPTGANYIISSQEHLNQAHCSALLIVSAHRIILPSSNNFHMFWGYYLPCMTLCAFSCFPSSQTRVTYVKRFPITTSSSSSCYISICQILVLELNPLIQEISISFPTLSKRSNSTLFPNLIKRSHSYLRLNYILHPSWC